MTSAGAIDQLHAELTSRLSSDHPRSMQHRSLDEHKGKSARWRCLPLVAAIEAAHDVAAASTAPAQDLATIKTRASELLGAELRDRLSAGNRRAMTHDEVDVFSGDHRTWRCIPLVDAVESAFRVADETPHWRGDDIEVIR
jgi:hypothetical protein